MERISLLLDASMDPFRKTRILLVGLTRSHRYSDGVSAKYRLCLVKTTETGVAELRMPFQGSRVQRLKSKLVFKELEFFGIILPHQALIAISRIPIRHQILITPI